MSLVVDASVLVAALVDAGPTGRWAEAVIGEADLLAPHLVLVEAANILRRLERAKRWKPAEAVALHDDLLRLDLVLFPYEPFAQRIWTLRENVTSYDAWYVAIAEALEVPLATLDSRLARAAGDVCRFRLPG